MKKIIKKVIDRHKDGQGNLASDSFRDMLSTEIAAVLAEEDDWSNPLTEADDESLSVEDLEKIKKTWTCEICGGNTFDVDYDYLGSNTNHLGCELKLQEDGSDEET